MLSVVIITCNRAKTLIKTIISCKNHISIPWELVIVDNGSSDGTRGIVEDLCYREGIELQYKFSTINLGVAGARNVGYEIAKGDILYFIDDDAYIESDYNCIDNAYNYLKSKENVQILSTKIYDTLWKGILPEITENKLPMKSGVNLRCFIGCSHFIKKNENIQIPVYPDNLFYGAEEIYLSNLVHSKGLRIEYYEDVFVYHNPSKNTRTSKYDTQRNKILNWYIVKRYIYPYPYNILSFLVFIIRILKLTRFSIKKIKSVYKLYCERYSTSYNRKISYSDMKSMVKKFGMRYMI